MCGIAGSIQFNYCGHSAKKRSNIILSMLAAIAHRGPDETGFMTDSHVTLGTVRLKINDLSEGQQPMSDESERWWLSYNGEVYNFIELRSELEHLGHRFISSSDTEVVLKAWIQWGEKSLEKFDGGFAFALYDRLKKRLFLARDRYGKRPLFIRRQSGALAFASEIKAFVSGLGESLNWSTSGLSSMFSKWVSTDTETVYKNVTQVAPGSFITIDIQSQQEKLQHFDGFCPPQRPEFKQDASIDDIAEVRSLLANSVKLRLRSDRDVGVLLSGGLDSSIIACLANEQLGKRLHSFSVAFKNSEFDESQYQRLVAKKFELKHHTIEIGEDEIPNTFQEALWHAEVPQFRTAFVPIYLLAREIRKKNVPVVLSGEGADEVFLGYDIFRETRLRAQWDTYSPNERRNRLRQLYPYLPLFSEEHLSALEVRFSRTVGEPTTPLFSHDVRFEHGRFAKKLLLEQDIDGLENLLRLMSEGNVNNSTSISRAQWLEFKTLLEGYLLSSQGDRMLFAHGIEPRNPFLSKSIISAVSNMPEEWLLDKSGCEKKILKEAFASELPPEIINKPKQPYLAPDARSFKLNNKFYPWVEESLLNEELKRIDGLDLIHANRLVSKIRRVQGDRISPRESQSFMFLLSLSVLNRQFITPSGAYRSAADLGPIVCSKIFDG